MKTITLTAYNHNIVRAMRSLEMKEKEVPVPTENQVLIKMNATPCNPSDIAFILGGYNIKRPLPAVPGFEATGEVVDAGVMREARDLIGNRVSCFIQDPAEDGTWSEYFVTDWQNCIELHREMDDEQAATLCINPFTAYALFDMAEKKGCNSFIQNAAAGQIGRFLNNLAKEKGMKVVNLVRKAEQIEELNKEGFELVLDITDENFSDNLSGLAADVDARIAFDAVGGELSGHILNAMPEGSDLVLYGGLSGQSVCNVKTMGLIFEDKTITGFNLGDWKDAIGINEYHKISKEVQDLVVSGKMKAVIQGKFSLDQHQEALTQYIRNMSKGKILFTP
jgi:NADPH:quinone reductase-like Zn-dependent oxidoreductase